MTLPHQDPVIAGALAQVPVPPPGDEFWTRLEGRLARLDDVHALPPILAASPAAADVDVVVSFPPSSPPPPASPRWAWRVLASAAAALVVVGIVVQVGRDPASVDRPAAPAATADLPADLPPASASPTDVLAAYKRARDAGDERTAAALLGPRAAADVAAGGRPPYLRASEKPPLHPGAKPVEWPDDWQRQTTVFPLTEQFSLVQVHTASPYSFTFVLWRPRPGQRWLVEGPRAGRSDPSVPRGTGAGGVVGGNGVEFSLSIPEAGHAWVFVDGKLHAEQEFPAATSWQVPPVAPTSPPGPTPPDPAAGRDVVTVFIGDALLDSEGTRFG